MHEFSPSGDDHRQLSGNLQINEDITLRFQLALQFGSLTIAGNVTNQATFTLQLAGPTHPLGRVAAACYNPATSISGTVRTKGEREDHG